MQIDSADCPYQKHLLRYCTTTSRTYSPPRRPRVVTSISPRYPLTHISGSNFKLAKVREFVLQGWPSSVSAQDLKPFITRQQELSVEQGCVLRGSRVVVPTTLKGKVLELLHDGHPGVVRMKMLARQYVWWPGIDKGVKDRVKAYVSCQESQKAPPQAPLHPWKWPVKPWVRIHANYAGPFMGIIFLIIIDAHSKWMEVYPTGSSSSQITIEKLRLCFASLGLPEQLITNQF